jgi:hypothetical protein
MKRIDKIQKKLSILLKSNNNNYDEKFLNKNKKWLFEFSLDFIKKLKNWQKFHKKELFNLSKILNNINKKNNKNTFL